VPTDDDEKPDGGAEKSDEETPTSEDGKDEERPTVAPPFDPISFAKGILDSAPPSSVRGPSWQGGPPSGQNPHTKATPVGGIRAPMPTYSDPAALEEARRKSLEAIAGKGSALSVVNARVPSNIPPPATKPAGAGAPLKFESLSSMNAVDAEWAQLEAETRPPPPGQNPEDFDIPSTRSPGADLSRLGAIARGSAPPEEPIPTVPPVIASPIIDSGPPSEKPNDKQTAPPPAFVAEEPDPFASPKAVPAEEKKPAAKKSIREEGPPTEQEMNDRVSLGDYTGALAIAEKLLASDPGNVAVQACAENCRTVLRQMYVTKIGPLDRVPTVAVPRDQLRWLSIDHRAGFVLSLVDGVSSLEMILDVSGMPELDTLRILSELAQQRIIAFR